MKKKLVLTVLGLAVTATASYGQGGIVFNNGPNGGPYAPILWDSTVGGGLAGTGVRSTQGVIVTIWFGEGAGLLANQLTAGPQIVWNSGFEGGGFYGYYTANVTLPTWTAGDTFTFQLRASGSSVAGPATGASVLWEENANIKSVGGTPAGTPGTSANVIGFTVAVPEPSTFALAGLGALALVFRRRNS